MTHLLARLAKSTVVFHAIVPHNRRIIQPTVTHSSQSGSHKRTPGCMDKKNVGHKGSIGAIWLSIFGKNGSDETCQETFKQ